MGRRVKVFFSPTMNKQRFFFACIALVSKRLLYSKKTIVHTCIASLVLVNVLASVCCIFY